MIIERPAEALEILKKRFSTMDPTLLASAWQVVSKAHAKDIRVPLKGLENAEKVSLEAKLLKPEDALKTYDGLYTAEYVQ
jgi:DNA-binding protein YbaB